MTLDDLPRDGLTLAYFQDSGHGWIQAPVDELCMASVETIADQDLARSMGWRTYRIRRQGEPLATNEIACPSDINGRQCIACKACDGALKPTAASVAIIWHGPKAKALT